MTSVTIDNDKAKSPSLSSDLDHDQSLSSNESENSCPFNAEISTKLTAAFAKATGIDVELAVHLLSEHGWNIDQALRATYEAKDQAQPIITTKNTWKTNKENYLRILSWNLDIPDSEDEELNELIQQRTEKIIEILQREKPQIILLQQVGTLALTLIITCLSADYDDESIQIDAPRNYNYISIFTRKSDVIKSNTSICEHSDQWKMLQMKVVYKNSLHLNIFNVCIDENPSAEEILNFSFQQINQTSSNEPILCAISSRISDDLWDGRSSTLEDLHQMTGEQAELIYTYDPMLNSNIAGREKAARHDRLFFRNSTNSSLKPVHLELEGIEHVPSSTDLFPSTHWAVQGYFETQN